MYFDLPAVEVRILCKKPNRHSKYTFNIEGMQTNGYELQFTPETFYLKIYVIIVKKICCLEQQFRFE